MPSVSGVETSIQVTPTVFHPPRPGTVPRMPRRATPHRPHLTVATDAGPVVCRVVRHPRARRLTLRAGPTGVRVTVPVRTPARAIEEFVREQSGWIARTLAAAPAPVPLADGDHLPHLDESLTLRVHAGPRAVARLDGDRLVVQVPAGTDPGPAVERWYRRRARLVLGAMAADRAAALGVEIAGLSIRDPRSRWGSCSASGRLSLSWRLMLMPAAVAGHVVAHEVCHLRHLDHSPAFWALLARTDPDCEAHRAWLRRVGPLLAHGPGWRTVAAGLPAPPEGGAGDPLRRP